jgi:hemolysin activation/secretion protein
MLNKLKTSTRVLLFLVAGTFSLSGQDLSLVMPEAPSLLFPEEQDLTDEQIDLILRELMGAWIDEGEEVILAEIKQIIFLREPGEVDLISLSAGEVTNLTDRPDLNAESVRFLVELAIGNSASQESLDRLLVAVRTILATEGRVFSLVYLPPQDITDGTLQIVIQPSLLGQIRVEGNRFFSDASYLNRVRLSPGQPIDIATLRTGIDRINRNPFRVAAVEIAQGQEPVTTDFILQVRELRPYRVFAGYNNTGTRVTTEDRVFAGITLGNLWGQAHQLTLQATSDLDFRYSKSLSGNYRLDLPRNHELVFLGAYSEIESVPNEGLDQEGRSWQVGANYTIPLAPFWRYTHRIVFGADFKFSDNNLELNLPPFIIPISDTLTHVIQARLEYRGTIGDNWGMTDFGIGLTASPGGIGSKNSSEAFEAARFNADPQYVYLSLDGTRTLELGAWVDVLSNWTWQLRADAQFASTNLLGSEQFSAGGVNSVRGYEQGEVIGDNAVFLSQELQLPGYVRPLRLGNYEATSILRFFLFQDFARTWSTDKLPEETAFNLHSAGLGMRYQLGQTLSANLSHGWQLRETGRSSTTNSYRTHISVQLSY